MGRRCGEMRAKRQASTKHFVLACRLARVSLFRWIALPDYTPLFAALRGCLFCERWLALPFGHIPIHGLALESNYGWL